MRQQQDERRCTRLCSYMFAGQTYLYFSASRAQGRCCSRAFECSKRNSFRSTNERLLCSASASQEHCARDTNGGNSTFTRSVKEQKSLSRVSVRVSLRTVHTHTHTTVECSTNGNARLSNRLGSSFSVRRRCLLFFPHAHMPDWLRDRIVPYIYVPGSIFVYTHGVCGGRHAAQHAQRGQCTHAGARCV